MPHDLVFKNATVIDGTGAPRFGADVAVAGDRIAEVGAVQAAAGRTIDARGLALCPGFVDMHGHSDYYLLILPGADGKILQGVTTEVIGSCGYSAAPVAGELARDRKESHRELYGLELDWESFEGYLARLEAARPAINVAPQVGFNTVRASVGLFSSAPPTPAELGRMKAMVTEAFAAGAFGLSLGLIYPPAAFAGIDELTELAKLAANAGGFVSSHIRSEGDRLLEAIRESLEIASRAEVQFQVSHLKTSGPANWGKLEPVFNLIEAARAKGLRVFADRYPYLASFTQLSAALPEWVLEGGKAAFFARLADPQVRARARAELKKADTIGDRWDRVVISITFDDDLKKYEGRSVAEAAAAAGQDPVDFLCAAVLKCQDRAAATYHTMSTGNLERILKKDWVMVGSDASVRTTDGPLSEGKPHPRAYGTMPRMLAWVVRDRGWLTAEAAVHKMTLLPCQTLGLKDRGQIKPGFKADLVLLDLDRVKDAATYDDPKQYPAGIRLVAVNGRIAVENGKLTGQRAGVVLRKN